jgi:hypothetical protein
MAYKYANNPGIQDNVSLRSAKTNTKQQSPASRTNSGATNAGGNVTNGTANGTLKRYEIR